MLVSGPPVSIHPCFNSHNDPLSTIIRFHVMIRFRRHIRWLQRVVTSLAAWTASGGVALAAGESSSNKSWTVSWFIVSLAVILGLLVVLRPIGRTTDVKIKKED